MKRIMLSLTLLGMMSTSVWAQNSVKMTYKYGSENTELQKILDFENIYTEELTFESKDLKGKHYQVDLQEFDNGQLVSNRTLFDSSRSEYLEIDSDKLTLKFFFKPSDSKLKTHIRGERFGTKKFYNDLKGNADEYVLKDFFGAKKELMIDLKKPNAIFAIITPTKYADGSGSYCAVVQSDVAPEQLGTHFNIPHYFLVKIKFK